jgi:tetratricopeptide (TPR) repeat protein
LRQAETVDERVKLAPEWLRLSGKLYARIGKVKEAEQTFAKMSSRLNDSVSVVSLSRSTRGEQAAVNLVKGEIALAKGRTAEAVESLELASTLDNNAYNLESLAYAYFKAGRLDDAVIKYQEILTRPRVFGNEQQESWINAQLQLGKIFELKHDPAKARQSYENMLHVWRDGDSDLVMLREAKTYLDKM